MNSPDPFAAFCAGDGPAKPAIIRVGRTASVPVPATGHALPALLLAFELHDATSYILVLYYYKRREDSRGERQE